MEVVIGFDINEFGIQVSYAPAQENAPVKTLQLSGKGDGTVVEALICKRHEVNQWYYGVDALQKAKMGQGILIENLWRRFVNEKEVTIEKEQYDTALLCNLLLKRILRGALDKIRQEMQQEIAVRMLVITAEPFPNDCMERVERMLDGLEVDRKQIYLQTHEECLFAYLVHQPQRMLGYETGVMDLSNEMLVSYRTTMNHRARPVTVCIERQEVPHLVRKKHYPSISEHDRALTALDEQFCDYAADFVNGRLVTTIYLVGSGFDGDWCQESLKVLCRNRKVYAGNNLYSKGAVYGGLSKIAPSETDAGYLFLGRGMLKDNIGIMVASGGKEEYCPLLDAGLNWYDAKNEITLMLERADEITLLITPVNGGAAYEEQIALGALDQREDGTYRIRLFLQMQSETTLAVTVTDEGFGEIFPPSGQQVEKTIELEGGR